MSRTIELTDEEVKYVHYCLVMGTAVVAKLPILDILAGTVLEGINNGSHKSVLEKISPEFAAQVAEEMEKGRSIEEMKGAIQERADLIRAVDALETDIKNAH